MLKKNLRKQTLLHYSFWNLFDKGLVFLLPFIVITLFKAKHEYVQLEYIISVVTILITFMDLGINSYMFYHFQNTINKKKALLESQKINGIYFLGVLVLSLLVMIYHFFFPINEFILFILARCLFVFLTNYLISYYRLKDKPTYALYFTLSVNISTFTLLLIFYILKLKLSLSLLFISQIFASLVIAFMLLKSLKRLMSVSVSFGSYIKKSILYSWPTMIQVLIMMYLANYGKINALAKLSEDEGVFLGFTMRFCMIIQLAHASFLGYFVKKLYICESLFTIDKKILKQYIVIIFTVYLFVLTSLIITNIIMKFNINNLLILQLLLTSYTLVWCLYSFFELFFSRINKNIFKLYFVIVNALIFIGIVNTLSYGFLFNISIALFFSTFVTFLVNIFSLKKLNFKIA